MIFIKAVSDTVFDMINVAYYDKPLIIIKAVSDTVLDMINVVYHHKPLIFIGATFREKLAFHNHCTIQITYFSSVSLHYFQKTLF